MHFIAMKLNNAIIMLYQENSTSSMFIVYCD